jgi:hypothetical protein
MTLTGTVFRTDVDPCDERLLEVQALSSVFLR